LSSSPQQLAVAALVTTLQLTLGHGGPARIGSNPRSPAVPPDNSVVEVDPDTGRIEATITGLASGSPEFPARHVEVGEGGVWVDTAITLQHIDPSSGKVVAQIKAQVAVAAIAVGQGAVWAAGNVGFSRISPATDQVEVTIPFDTGMSRPVRLVVHGGDVWVLVSDGRLIRIDAGRNRITKQLATTGEGEDLAVGEGALWAVDGFLEQVNQLDWATGHVVDHIRVAGKLDRVVAGLGAVWVLDDDAGVVTPIDLATRVPAEPIRVGEKPVDMAIGLGAVWVLNRGDASITRIDSITHDTSTIEVGGPVASIAIDAASKALWVYLTQ
jgi:hypothetical protein